MFFGVQDSKQEVTKLVPSHLARTARAGVGGGGGVTSYIWHSTDLHAEWPPFSALPGIWLAPFFQQKVYEWLDFSGFLCERPHFSDILVYAHIFHSEIFRGCLSSWYYMNWLWYLSNNQQKKWVQKIKEQCMNRSTFWMIKYMNGSVFSKARYMNGVGFEILARTPVPKLPLSYPPPPTHTHTRPPSPRHPPTRRTVETTSLQHVNLVLLNPDMPCLCKQCRSRSEANWSGSALFVIQYVNLY